MCFHILGLFFFALQYFLEILLTLFLQSFEIGNLLFVFGLKVYSNCPAIVILVEKIAGGIFVIICSIRTSFFFAELPFMKVIILAADAFAIVRTCYTLLVTFTIFFETIWSTASATFFGGGLKIGLSCGCFSGKSLWIFLESVLNCFGSYFGEHVIISAVTAVAKFGTGLVSGKAFAVQL